MGLVHTLTGEVIPFTIEGLTIYDFIDGGLVLEARQSNEALDGSTLVNLDISLSSSYLLTSSLIETNHTTYIVQDVVVQVALSRSQLIDGLQNSHEDVTFGIVGSTGPLRSTFLL